MGWWFGCFLGFVPLLNFLAGFGHGFVLAAEEGEGLSLGGGDFDHPRVPGIFFGVALGEFAALGEFDFSSVLDAALAGVADRVGVACLGVGEVVGVAGGFYVGAVGEVAGLLAEGFGVGVAPVDACFAFACGLCLPLADLVLSPHALHIALDAVGAAAVVADFALGLGLEAFGELFDVLACLLFGTVSFSLVVGVELLLAVFVDGLLAQVLDRFELERVLDLEDADGFCLCVLNVVEAGFDVVFLDEPFG